MYDVFDLAVKDLLCRHVGAEHVVKLVNFLGTLIHKSGVRYLWPEMILFQELLLLTEWLDPDRYVDFAFHMNFSFYLNN